MEINWVDVPDSKRVVAVAYVSDQEMICVRFPNGKEWCYEACTQEEFDAFCALGTSKGLYIHNVLNRKYNHGLG